MLTKSAGALLSGARDLYQAALGLVYPTLCLGCGVRIVGAAKDDLPICPACSRKLSDATPVEVRRRLAELPESAGVFDEAFALWVFDSGGTIQQLQHALKYQNRPHLGITIGAYIGRALADPEGRSGYDALIPGPLSRRRLLERGYNQSLQLALGVAQVLGAPVLDGALTRRRATRSQTNLSRTRRWENVAGAFALAEKADLRGRRILLVDDVLTTGATLTAAALPLREAGATTDLAVFAVVAV